MNKNKYLKYYKKNQIGGNIILENAKKYYKAYNDFIYSNKPLDLNQNQTLKSFLSFISIYMYNSFTILANKRSESCQIMHSKTQFFSALVDILTASNKLLDFNFQKFEDSEKIYNENIYQFYLNTGKSLLLNCLYNCIKYKYYDLQSANHIDRTSSSNLSYNYNKYKINENIHGYEHKSLQEIKEIIEQSPDITFIKKNIINVFGVYDDIFDDYYINDILPDVYLYIKCNKLLNCFNYEKFDLSHIYKYNFKNLNSDNELINKLFDKIKYIYLPISIYSYDSDILYKMNEKLMHMYNPILNIEEEIEYFNNYFVKLSFIIVYCLLIVKNMINNNNCIEAINTTIGNLPYKTSSSFCYRGIFIDKTNFNIDKLSYQVKVNSFGRDPSSVVKVLEFYYKSLNDLENQIIILYIAKNDKNFIPIQFFNSEIDTAESEKETVTLPFVKYNCRLIYDYNKTTKIIIDNNDLDINIEEIHKTFFMEIGEREFDFQVYYIESIENLVDF
jgi:hypothetical protein